MPTVVFDLDGTLVDSAPGIAMALNKALDAHGHAPAPLERITPLLGGDAVRLAAMAIAHGGAKAGHDESRAVADHFLDIYSRNPVEGSALYPDTLDVLERLRDGGHALAICTNKPAKTGRPVLAAFGLEAFFDAVSFGDSGAHKKPDGRHILNTLNMIAGAPSRAVMVGDGANDILAARDAGVCAILVDYGYDVDAGRDAVPDHEIHALTELPAMLGRSDAS